MWNIQYPNQDRFSKIKSQFMWVLSSGGFLLALFYLSIHRFWPVDKLFALICFSGFLGGYVMYETGRLLPSNHPVKNKQLYTSLGMGNMLTIFRGLCISMAGGFLVVPAAAYHTRWIPGMLYLFAIVTDVLDGYYARKLNHVSVMGKRLDTELDAFGILIASSLGIHYEMLPAWYVLIGIAYYLFYYGKGYRSVKGKPINNLPGSTHGPLLAGIQMGFLSMSIFPVFSANITMIVGDVFGIPFLVSFLRDWLIVSDKYVDFFSHIKKRVDNFPRFVDSVLLPLVRVATLAVGIYGIVSGQIAHFPKALISFNDYEIHVAVEVVTIGLLVILICIGLGVFHRIASLAMMGFVALMMSSVSVYLVILLVLGGIMIQTGPGRFVLLNWDEKLFIRNVSQRKQHE